MKKLWKQTLQILLGLLLCLALGACASTAAESDRPAADSTSTAAQARSEAAADARQTLKIGATPTPHAEILKAAQAALKAKGIDLQIVEFTEYSTLNPALESGDLDANYFQHSRYLNDYNEQQHGHLLAVGKVHYEPYGLYGGRQKTLDKLPEGASIAIPNDVTNEARALLLLEQAKLIKLKAGAGIRASVLDIAENPHKLKIVELAAEQIPRALPDVDYAVINGNYALAAGLNVAKDALVVESADGEAGQVYANVIAVREADRDLPAIQALLDVLHSPELQKWIKDKYQGSVLPVR